MRNSFTRKRVYPIEFDGRVFRGRSPRLGTPDTDLGPTGVTVGVARGAAAPPLVPADLILKVPTPFGTLLASLTPRARATHEEGDMRTICIRRKNSDTLQDRI